jgi:hypothetical protein
MKVYGRIALGEGGVFIEFYSESLSLFVLTWPFLCTYRQHVFITKYSTLFFFLKEYKRREKWVLYFIDK